jgi:hypothetical protein
LFLIKYSHLQITGRWCRFFCSIDRVGQKCHVYDKSLRSNHSSYSKPFDSSLWQVLLRRKSQIGGRHPSTKSDRSVRSVLVTSLRSNSSYSKPFDTAGYNLPRCFPSPMVPPECSKVFFPFMILGTSSCCGVLPPAP